jgi:hypothetical protein
MLELACRVDLPTGATDIWAVTTCQQPTDGDGDNGSSQGETAFEGAGTWHLSSVSLDLTTEAGDTVQFPDSFFREYVSELRIEDGSASLVIDFDFNTTGHPENETFGILGPEGRLGSDPALTMKMALDPDNSGTISNLTAGAALPPENRAWDIPTTFTFRRPLRSGGKPDHPRWRSIHYGAGKRRSDSRELGQ